MPDNSYITFNIFRKFPELLCAFSTRCGGISTGNYQSLNVGFSSGDNRSHVKKNRKILFSQLGFSEAQTAVAGQIHSNNTRWILKPGFYPETDAFICNQANIFLTIQTADCFPLMIYIPDSHIVACVHCGWRGVADGIVQNVLKTCNVSLRKAFAVIGPGLQKSCFEVGRDVFTRFDPRYFSPHPHAGKQYLDLQTVIADTLLEWGFNRNNIYRENICTHCEQDTFYSYRRNGQKSGRMMGIIGMPGSDFPDPGNKIFEESHVKSNA